MLYGAIDGTGVTMTAKETAGREGKGEDGRARTREVKLAVFFTQDDVDEKGYPVRDRDSSSYIAAFEPAAVFGDLVKAEGIRRGADHVRQLTILGDGAAWIWNIATGKFPEATQIVDLFHAREHLRPRPPAGIHARRPQGSMARRPPRRPRLRRHQRHRSRHPRDPLAGIKKNEIDTALGYFENNAHRMRYKWFRSRGLFVGSGLVESGCKAVIGQRLNSPACAGPSPEPTPSPPSAASRPAAPKTASGNHVTTRQPPPDQPHQLNDLDHLQN